MSRTSFSRDELLMALNTAAQILKGFPNVQYEAEPIATAPATIADGVRALPENRPRDGAIVGNGYGKGIPQPARLRHALAPKVSLERVDWRGVPRAARRIVEDLGSHGPATSHELMERLQIARPTFNNAMSKLRKRRLVASERLHNGGGVAHR